MKKSIFILAALFAATFANAQITFERSFDNEVNYGAGVQTITSYPEERLVIGNYIYENKENAITIYDAVDYSLLKSILIPDQTEIGLVSKGIFTKDNKWAWIQYDKLEENYNEYGCHYYSAKVVDEDGNVLSTFVNKAICESYVKLVKIGASYKLMIETDIQKHSYDIYSLPGNGETQDISSNSAPRYSSRKYLHNDQVLTDSNERTYTVQGLEVK